MVRLALADTAIARATLTEHTNELDGAQNFECSNVTSNDFIFYYLLR